MHSIPSPYDFSVERAFSSLEERASARTDLDSEEDAIAFYLHTSGSTGHPKLVPWKQRTIVAIILTVHTHRPHSIGETVYTNMSLSHAAGALLSWAYLLGLRGRFIFLAALQPPTAISVLKDLQNPSVERGELIFSPNILEDLCDGPHRETGIEASTLKHFKAVTVSGAPLRQDVGFLLSHSGIRLMSTMGMSETGSLSAFYPHVSRNPDDWQYFAWVDTYRIEMVPVSEDDVSLRELVVFPKSITPCVLNQHDPDCFSTNDLFQRHPDPAKHMLWKHVGRKDDLIVLSNGLKANARQLDSLLCASPLIEKVALFGRGRFQVGALISPVLGEDSSSQAYQDNVWSYVATSVNPVVPQYARFVRPLLLFASVEKPFLFTDKGTLRTQATLALYQGNIDTAYIAFLSGDADASTLPSPAFRAGDRNMVVRFLTDIVSTSIGRRIEEDTDVFLAGGDSMMAMRVTSALEAALRRSDIERHLSRNIVYKYPTISVLADMVLAMLESTADAGNGARKARSPPSVQASLATHRQAFLERIRAISDEKGDLGVCVDTGNEVVFAITGTTGSLGVFLVSQLLLDYAIRKVYLLYRKRPGSSARELHERAFTTKGADFAPLSTALATGRAIFVEVDIVQPSLGIDNGLYMQIASEITHIVHAAWAVNFNLSLKSFEPHLIGVQRIVDLALSAPKSVPPRILFLSSVAVMGGRPGVAACPVPECPLESTETYGSMGYGQSKFVAEKLLEAACEHVPRLSVAIVRSGQLSGSLNGRWARSEYVPIIMKASVQLGKVPDKLADARWLPLDIAAEALLKLATHSNFSPRRGHAAFYHLEAARTTSWPRIAAAICRFPSSIGRAEQCQLVLGEDWLAAVANGPDNVARRLLPFFETMFSRNVGPVSLETLKMREIIGELLDFVVNEELLERYVAYACE
ncbi:acetyl-CoA synthetase-like protein [Vararia minispora EC-137]|uniref:Acetyl-CoA synthetase-like protein n=1 Tax=Vararia minispora EC-137 TaxID=1314806 RepID=A0ACB8QNZ0_9AGAM|nr:acetyl-CoA synthetase-like protein [Vararia minispora EC-137]